jgi:23S rRNA pseudouridine1911/1915/1917 synthase
LTDINKSSAKAKASKNINHIHGVTKQVSRSPQLNSSHWSWVVPETPLIQERADIALLKASELGISPPLSLTRNQLKKLFEEQKVTQNGEILKANSKLKTGCKIIITLDPPQPMELEPEDIPLDILYEDTHLLVLNKPPGLTVHPSQTQMTGTLVHALLHHIKDLSGIGGVLRPGIVHRIDKDTSGALVITKTDQAHTILAQTFAQHDIQRSYWALCYGSPSIPLLGKLHKIESLIGRHPTDRKKMSMQVKEGRKAVTYVKKLKEFGLSHKKPFASWLEATLETGRTHQVRVHLSGLGHSLLGDPVYGTPTERHPKWLALPEKVRLAVEQLPGQALHARTLGFKHPITGQNLEFEAKLPDAYQNLLNTLEQFIE